MSSKIEILRTFKNELITFFDELIQQFPEEGDFVIVRIFMKDRIPVEEIMNYFIHKLLPLKPAVKKRDEVFFLENNDLFTYFSPDKVNHFKRLWRSGKLDDDDKEVIFRWFESFIYLGEKFSSVE